MKSFLSPFRQVANWYRAVQQMRTLRFMSRCFLTLLFVTLTATAAYATLGITATTNQALLRNALEGTDVTVSNVTVNEGLTTGQIGTFTGGITGGTGPVIGIDNGVVMVTGTATSALGPNSSYGISTSGETGPTDSDLQTVDGGDQFDTAVLSFNVVPSGNFMALDFVFGSDEYNEYVCSRFNDAMGIFVSGPGISGLQNIARLSTTSRPISVNTVNRGVGGAYQDGTFCDLGNSNFYVKNLPDSETETTAFNSSITTNYTNLQYDGFTVPLTAQVKVTPGSTYTMKIVIADIGDGSWDSGLFLDRIRSFNLDLGDAPDSYGTKPVDQTIQIPGPARHTTGQDIYLGVTVPDAENTVTPAIAPNAADADDLNGTNDEDAFSGDLTLTSAITTHSINNIPVHNGTASTAKLMGWIDFNQDGDFLDAGELTTANVAPSQTTANLSWSGFTAPTIGTSYARFRITTDPNITNSLTPLGLAIDGEVEDYRVTISAPVISNPNVLLVKRITKINNQNLTAYEQQDTNPYDDNELEPTLAPIPPTYPTADTTKWPLTTGKTDSTFLVGKFDGGSVKPNDSIEYTIYFLSTGNTPAKNVLLCDRVPTNVTFIPTAFNTVTPNTDGLSTADRGIAIQRNGQELAYTNTADGDDARYYPPNELLPNGCKKTPTDPPLPNPNGTVVVDLKTIPNATTAGEAGTYGFVRFRGQVK